MNNNKKFLVYGTIATVVLVILAVFLYFGLSKEKDTESFDVSKLQMPIYKGVPSDAISIFDAKNLKSVGNLFDDTLSFVCKLLDNKNGLVRLQKELLKCKELEMSPFVYSLHYSAKNSVSFLEVLQLGDNANSVESFLLNDKADKRKYNNVTIYSLPYGVFVAEHKGLLLASTSTYVLESSIRHLENGTSILDNKEFEKLITKHGNNTGMYINHHQIGKLFSGIVERGFLGYSDFFLKLSSWTYMAFNPSSGKLNLNGYFVNRNDESFYSYCFANQSNKKSLMSRILPSSTIMAISLPFSSVDDYLRSHMLFLEVGKKAGTFAYKQKLAQDSLDIKPVDWVSSLAFEELVEAYCKFGEKCEWITLFRQKQSFGLNNVISTVVDRPKVEAAVPFKYKGYLASVFGNLFSNCSEDYVCKVGAWTILGPKSILDEFVNGNAYYFNLDSYLSQTPVGDFCDKEAVLKTVINVKEAGDSLLNVFKPYSKACISNQLQKNNFEYITIDVIPDEKSVGLNVDFYSCFLEKLPKAKEREDGQQAKFQIDSTINLPSGPFEVYDASKKAKAYLEQLPNMKLRYLDASKKGVWAIPFETPICGYVQQIDLFNNGKLQMAFVSGNKFYLLDRLGRFVNGYPKKLKKEAVCGPLLIKNQKNEKYSFVVINADNTISWFGADGNVLPGWTDIVAPEFIKELPVIYDFGKDKYWVLKAPSQLLIYTINGKPVVLADKKRKLDRDCEPEFISSGLIKVKCTDGKDYSFNLETGKLKKL